jgi:hypothetical protein
MKYLFVVVLLYAVSIEKHNTLNTKDLKPYELSEEDCEEYCEDSDPFKSLFDMNMIEQKRREGFVAKLTPDSGNGVNNIGYGVNNTDTSKYKNGITREDAETLLLETYNKHYLEVVKDLPNATYNVHLALTNLSFNCGWAGFKYKNKKNSRSGYTRTYTAFLNGEYERGAEMLLEWCYFGKGEKRKRSDHIYKSRLFDKALVLMDWDEMKRLTNTI